MNYAQKPLTTTVHTDMNGLIALEVPKEGCMPGHFYEVFRGLDKDPVTSINFQHGPVPANGVNGVTNEALLAIVLHRTRILDAKFPCKENQAAIQHLEDAMAHLEARTYRRQLRGVEGKEVK